MAGSVACEGIGVVKIMDNLALTATNAARCKVKAERCKVKVAVDFKDSQHGCGHLSFSSQTVIFHMWMFFAVTLRAEGGKIFLTVCTSVSDVYHMMYVQFDARTENSANNTLLFIFFPHGFRQFRPFGRGQL